MKKLFAKFKRKSLLSFDSNGVKVDTSLKESIVVTWDNITKIVAVGHFEEYSGYFLTEEYKSKDLYNDIHVDCSRNTVKIRTGGAPTVKNNTSEPFSRKFGTTCIYNVVFVEYKNSDNLTNLFAIHYKEGNKSELIKDLKVFLKNEKVFDENRIEGFSYISQL